MLIGLIKKLPKKLLLILILIPYLLKYYNQNFRKTNKEQTHPSNTTVYVGNLAPETLEHTVRLVFEKYGPIEEIRMQPDKGYAFVKYKDHTTATWAIIRGNGYISLLAYLRSKNTN